jgi:hypothetical protein
LEAPVKAVQAVQCLGRPARLPSFFAGAEFLDKNTEAGVAGNAKKNEEDAPEQKAAGSESDQNGKTAFHGEYDVQIFNTIPGG